MSINIFFSTTERQERSIFGFLRSFLRVFKIDTVEEPAQRYIQEQLHNHGFYAEADTGSDTLNKKVRNAQLAGWSYQAVVGAREEEDRT